MSQANPLTALAERLAGLDAIPETAVSAARRVFLDQWAVSFMGSRRRPPHFAHRLARSGAPEATTWSDGAQHYAPDAVLANRAAGDSLELTAGPECVAAAVAAAEVADASLDRLFQAIAIGSQVESAIRASLQSRVEQEGLHPPGFFAATGSAAATSWLFGNGGVNSDLADWADSADPMLRAIGATLCLLPSSPYVAFSQGSDLKELYGAFGQQLGFNCGLWSTRDRQFGGPESALDGKFGLHQAFGIDSSVEPKGARTAPNGPDPWAIERVSFKAYPCSRACHGALSALEELLPLTWQDIDSLEVETYPFAFALSERSDPTHPTGAQMHIPTALALRLVHGPLVPFDSFTPANVQDPNVTGLTARIRLTSFPATQGERRRIATVRCRTRNGAETRAHAEAKWGPHQPASEQELTDRFEQFTGRGSEIVSAPADSSVREWISAFTHYHE